MKKIIRTLLAVTLSAGLIGCGSSAPAGSSDAEAPVETDADYVQETATNFMEALNSGDMDKAMTFATADLANVFNIPELQEAKDSISDAGFSEKSQQEFSDFIDTIMGKVFQYGMHSYKLNDPVRVTDEEYTVNGTADIIDFSTALDIDFDAILDDDLVAQMQAKAVSDGVDAALEFAMTEMIRRIDETMTTSMQNSPTESASLNIVVTKNGDEWLVSDIDGLVEGASSSSSTTPSSTPASTGSVMYDAHGLTFAGGDGWYQLTGEDAQGSTFAVQNDNYNGAIAQIHFTEQSNPGLNGGDAITNYVNNQLVKEVQSNYEAGGVYDTVTAKAVVIDGTPGVWVEGKASGGSLYELDIPIDTGDGNLTMIAVLSVYSDQTENLFREIVIK